MTTDRWHEASSLFDELVELDADARRARLAQLAADDADLAHAVAELLAADERDGGVLDAGIARASPTLADALSHPHEARDESGTTLGPFRLQRLLGRGGMGEVYLAERSMGDVRQPVAIKLLRRGMDSRELLQRFAQERRILAQLGHPHIARFLDGGVAPDGRPYFAMEYVEGRDIVRDADARNLDPRARVALLAQVCDAVAYAHSRLVVHRDLKPSNILVDANGQPRVLDFGIAKLIGDGDGDETTLTGTGARVMSPAYAAPEQILGEPAGTATDVYSLGVVLYELLTGVLPHRRNGTPEALARSLDTETVQRPSEVVRTQRGRRGRELAGDLDTIVLSALRREPERRYATAAALAEDLRRWLDGRPVAARTDSAAYRFGKFVRRHRAGVAAAALVLVALVAGLALALWQAGIARDQARRADAEAQRAEREAALAKDSLDRSKRVKDFLISVFLQEDPLRRDARGALTMAQAFEDAKARIDTELADDPKLRTDLLDDFGEIMAGKGEFPAAKALFERALALAEQTYGRDHPAVAESLINLSVVTAYQGDSLAAEPWLVRAVAILEKHADSETAGLATALSALGNLRHVQGRADEALALLQRVLEIERKRGSGEPRIAAMQNVATAMLDLGRNAEAEALLREAIAAIEQRYGAQSAQLCPALWSMEIVLYRQGRLDDERAYIERRLATARASFPGDHPWTADALTESGRALARAGEPEAGMARIREAIAMFQRLGRDDARPWNRLATIELEQGRPGDALASSAHAAALCNDGSRANHECLGMRARHAYLSARNGAYDAALTEADAVLVDAAPARRATEEQAMAQQARAAALSGLGRGTEALAAQRDAVALATAALGATHPFTRTQAESLEALAATGKSHATR